MRRYDADGTIVDEWDDAARVYRDHLTGTSRPYTDAENAAAEMAAAAAARADITQRLERIEAALWPRAADPTSSSDPSVKTMAEWSGVVPPGGLVRDGQQVYRNVTSVPLTTAPGSMPGGPGLWGHLWQPVTIKPTTPTTPTASAWATGVAYKVGDIVTYSGQTYACLQAHTSQAGWAPSAVASLWRRT